MYLIYPFLISFVLIFFSELGDKTQILVLSFSTKKKATHILLGVALGSLLSHGVAIIFGSSVANLDNDVFVFYLKFITYLSFIVLGVFVFVHFQKDNTLKNISTRNNSKSHFISFINSLTRNCVLLVACSIAIGELGDKTFLASIGLGIQYPLYKVSLICGAICGMLLSDSIAIFFGKWLSSKISASTIEFLSNIIFLAFGICGLIGLLI